MNNDYVTDKEKENIVISYIAEKVINKIIASHKSALLLFTGDNLGFNDSLKSLHSLKADGWQFTSVMSTNAEKVLNKQLIQDISSKSIINSESKLDITSLIKDYNLVIIPTLTISTASKIANCISDDLITNIIACSLKLGKKIVACTNACCPDNEERNTLGFCVTEAYKEKLRGHLTTMESFGVNLTIAENLEKKVNVISLKNIGLLYKGNYLKNEINMKYIDKIVTIKEKVINRGCISNNRDYSIIKVNKNSVITKLAKDEAEKLNIKIIKE